MCKKDNPSIEKTFNIGYFDYNSVNICFIIIRMFLIYSAKIVSRIKKRKKKEIKLI